MGLEQSRSGLEYGGESEIRDLMKLVNCIYKVYDNPCKMSKKTVRDINRLSIVTRGKPILEEVYKNGKK